MGMKCVSLGTTQQWDNNTTAMFKTPPPERIGPRNHGIWTQQLLSTAIFCNKNTLTSQSGIRRHICCYWDVSMWTSKIPDVLWTLPNAPRRLLRGNSAWSERLNWRSLVKTELPNVSIICSSADFVVLLRQWYNGSKKTCEGKPIAMRLMS